MKQSKIPHSPYNGIKIHPIPVCVCVLCYEHEPSPSTIEH